MNIVKEMTRIKGKMLKLETEYLKLEEDMKHAIHGLEILDEVQ